jgi:hypothetical protein
MSAKLNITIEQGATFSRTISLTDEDGVAIDLTGASVAGQIRKDYTSDTAYNFTLTITDEPGGEITWVLSAATSQDMPVSETDRYVYDVEVTYADGTIERILEGNVKLTPEVTR